LTLYGYLFQSDNEFQIVITDDGSGNETCEMIKELQSASRLSRKHAWHPDNGFHKFCILNRAIEALGGEYLILFGGDCVPRNDFINALREQAGKGYFFIW